MLTHVISIQFIKKVFQHSDADGKPPGSELQQPSFRQSHTQSSFPGHTAPAHHAGTGGGMKPHPHTAPLTRMRFTYAIRWALFVSCELSVSLR